MLRKCLLAYVLLFVPVAFAAPGFIHGKVVNSDGDPEAGVWVIAETDKLPTHYRKIVVTDDIGRFLIPELPEVAYEVWVRGYGIVDSKKTAAKIGDDLTIEVRVAENAMEAATVYPANYWLSMMEPPTRQELAKTRYSSPKNWLDQFKLNCMMCHQIGGPITRLPSPELVDYGFKKVGTMSDAANQLGRGIVASRMAEWAKMTHAGRTPKATPPRPKGIERNFVITQWAYGGPYTYSHDVVSTDKRNPYLYPNGLVYGLDLANDYLMRLDPNKHSWDQVKLPTYEHARPWCEQTYRPLNSKEETPSGARLMGCPELGAYTPHKGAYQNPVNPHNPMLDDSGRVWMTMQVRREWGEDLPSFCKKDPVIANNFHHRQLGYYDIKTGSIAQIDTCFGTHHLQFDKEGVLWVNGDGHVVGWFDTKKYDPANSASKETAQGWSEGKIDTDGDGIGDKSIFGFRYSIIPNLAKGDVWLGMPPGGLFPDFGEPGYILRFDPKSNTHEAYRPPAPGAGPRGVDVDTEGNVWVALAGSGHLARFNRDRCKRTWGDGEQCPEGWTLWPTPGPQFSGLEKSGPTDFHYYIWVDQFDVLGMGRDTVIINGTNSDSLIAFRPDTETFTTIRVPYPLGSYTRGLDGRIDNRDSGWKGRGLWITNGLDPIFMSETQRSFVGHVQLRPNPLAH